MIVVRGKDGVIRLCKAVGLCPVLLPRLSFASCTSLEKSHNAHSVFRSTYFATQSVDRMANQTPLGSLPRDLIPSLSDALEEFTNDAYGDDPSTSQGFHDVLERSHGLKTTESRRQITANVHQKRQQMAELDAQFRNKENLSDRAQQMKAELQDARRKMMEGQNILGKWKHTKKADVIQAGLDTISKFVTGNSAFLPDLLDMLKPSEAKLRSQVTEVSNDVSKVVSCLAEMQCRCDAYDQELKSHDIEQRKESDALVKELRSRLALAERRLDEKSQQLDGMTDRAKQAFDVAEVTQKELEIVRSGYGAQRRKLQESIEKSQSLQQIIDDQRNTINDQMATIDSQTRLITKLPGLNQYETLCRRLARLEENEASNASRSNETSNFSSLMLANISTFGKESYTREVDVQSLRVSWNMAAEWSQNNRTSLTHRESLVMISGLAKPVINCTDALTLARLLLIRTHTNPSYLSVALLEQLAAALSGAEENVATQATGFIYALLQTKARDFEEAGSWSYSKTLLVVRCLSILASYVQGGEICLQLVRIARSIRNKISSTLILIQVMLENAIKLLTNCPESLTESLRRSSIAKRVKTASHTLYPDGENLIVIDDDDNLGLVRPDQFHWHDEEYQSELHMEFVAAPLLGTCRVKLPGLIEEMYIFDILHDAISRAEWPGSSLGYKPDYVFVVE